MLQLLALVALFFSSQSPTTQQPAQTSQTPEKSESGDAATNAVARRKRFEEEKKRLEGQEADQTPPCTGGKPTLYITPTEAAMLVGESRGFALFDTDGHKQTKVAEWSVSSSYHAVLTPGDEPKVTAKNEGIFKVTARIDTRTAEATVKVYPGDKLPIGTVIWKVAPVPCSKNTGISKSVSAVPH